MRLARYLGLQVADVNTVTVENRGIIVVARYDREVDTKGQVERVKLKRTSVRPLATRQTRSTRKTVAHRCGQSPPSSAPPTRGLCPTCFGL